MRLRGEDDGLMLRLGRIRSVQSGWGGHPVQGRGYPLRGSLMGNKFEKENANGNGVVLNKLFGRIFSPSREADCFSKSI